MIADLFLSPLQYPFMMRALITGLLVGITCGLMGSYLLVKRWSLLGDAISHSVLPGVAVAYVLGWPYFVGALITGLLTALGIGFVERNSRIKSDAAMGIMFIGAFALGLALLSKIRSNVDVYHMLFGNILGVSMPDLWLTVAASVLVLLVVVLLNKELHLWSFDPVSAQVIGIPVRTLHYVMMFMLSMTIVAALRSVGLVLVIAMLITPTAAAYLLTHRFHRMMVLSALIGAFSAALGLYLSYHANIASGATMVLVATSIFILAFFFSPTQGLIWRRLDHRRAARRIALDDCLKVLHELAPPGPPIPTDTVAQHMGTHLAAMAPLLRRLKSQGLVKTDGQGCSLTAAGVRQARSLIRSHRLWERYLTDEAGLPWEAVHSEAHMLEHTTSTELAERLDAALGFPERDPHGAPIPSREGMVPPAAERSLWDLAPGDRAVIAHVADEDPDLLRRLRSLGLVPGRPVTVTSKDRTRMYLEHPDGHPAIDAGDARQIRVRDQT